MSGAVRRIQAPKQGPRRIGRVSTQGALRTQHRAIGRMLGEWQDTVRAVDYYTQADMSHARYVARQLDVNARAPQTY